MTEQRGATLIEAAIVLPVLFLLVLGMIDVGQLVFQHTQATAAARDGARVGILDYQNADGGSPGTYFAPPCSSLTYADQQTICNAIQRHLPNQTFQFSVECLLQPSVVLGRLQLILAAKQPTTTTLSPATTTTTAAPGPPAGVQEPCSSATVDQDQIQVNVRWTRGSFTAVLPANITVTGSSTLTILGLPQ